MYLIYVIYVFIYVIYVTFNSLTPMFAKSMLNSLLCALLKYKRSN